MTPAEPATSQNECIERDATGAADGYLRLSGPITALPDLIGIAGLVDEAGSVVGSGWRVSTYRIGPFEVLRQTVRPLVVRRLIAAGMSCPQNVWVSTAL